MAVTHPLDICHTRMVFSAAFFARRDVVCSETSIALMSVNSRLPKYFLRCPTSSDAALFAKAQGRQAAQAGR